MIKLKNKPSLIQALKIKLSEELQDYKVKIVLETERLFCLREGLEDYKKRGELQSLSRGRKRAILDLSF